MHLGIPRIIQGRLTNKHPADLQAAQMCLPFSVALAAKVALPPGRIPSLGVADYEAGLRDQSLHDLEERTTLDLDDEVEAASNALSTAAQGERATARRPQPVAPGARPQGQRLRSRSPGPSTRRGSRRNCRAGFRRRSVPRSCAMSKDLDRLDPRWLGRVLSEDPAAGG